MARVTAIEIPEEQMFFTDLWNLRKKYYTPEDNDDYWDSMVNEFTELRVKYEKVSISYKIILIVMDDLEMRYKENKYGK